MELTPDLSRFPCLASSYRSHIHVTTFNTAVTFKDLPCAAKVTHYTRYTRVPSITANTFKTRKMWHTSKFRLFKPRQ